MQNIEVKTNENYEAVVSGRELHEALEVKTAYKDWFPRMCEYGFIDGIDFCSNLSESTGGRPRTDHILKINMAKEVAMLQRTETGKKVRKYFIEIEKEFNNPERIMAQGLLIADRKIKYLETANKEQQEIITEMKPKAIFADSVSASQTTILIGELAKILKGNGVNIGQNRLFEKLREKGYLISRKGSDYNMPTQKSMDLKLFKIKETTITHADGHTSISKTTKVTGKGQQYFINLFLKNEIVEV